MILFSKRAIFLITMAQSDKKSKGKGDLSPEEIINQFQVLRGEQRIIANKLSEARTEIFEYK